MHMRSVSVDILITKALFCLAIYECLAFYSGSLLHYSAGNAVLTTTETDLK